MIKFNFPSSFWLISEQIGYARSVMNKENNKINKRFDRGNKNKQVDVLGVLGELIAIEYLSQKNIDFNLANLLDFKSSKNADFILKGKRIDVKTNKYTKYSHLLVNEEAHKKGLNKIDLYWFVYIIDKNTAEFYFVDYSDVSQWDCKLMKYTNAFYIKRENL
tara:strand:- start:107 stop:592 length:486 start_codon:yes stop_codon:yes gene_type:complete